MGIAAGNDMSSTTVISRFLVGALFAFSFPANTPWDKPADQWTAADANKILEDSPGALQNHH